MEKTQERFTKYERARILGARGLQLAMDAPVLIKGKEELLSNLNFDPLKIAELELDSGILPISVKRPMPERTKERLREVKIEETQDSSDEEKLKIEEREVKDIAEEGEIMELASDDEEFEEEAGTGSDSSEE